MPSKNKRLAENASKYSREQILEGSTQLANNEYDVNKRLALKQAIQDLRQASRDDTAFFLNIDNSTL